MVVVLYGSDRKITDSQGSRNVTPAQGETVLCSRMQKGPGLNMPKGAHMGHQRGWVRIRLQLGELSLFPLGVPLSLVAKALCRLHGCAQGHRVWWSPRTASCSGTFFLPLWEPEVGTHGDRRGWIDSLNSEGGQAIAGQGQIKQAGNVISQQAEREGLRMAQESQPGLCYSAGRRY